MQRATQQTLAQLYLGQAVHASVPAGIDYHHYVKAVRYQWQYPRYITKAKVSGYVVSKDTNDKYAGKRLLFTKEFGLNKCGHIGSFRVCTKGDLWRTIIAREQRIADGLNSPEVQQTVERWYTCFGGEVPQWPIERSFGYHHTTMQPPCDVPRDVVRREAQVLQHGSIIQTRRSGGVSRNRRPCTKSPGHPAV